ncbi:MAG: tRNA (adenosine(37)-N6)-threonylcarbamoyltransferase complex transferase subunit TsaD [Candidatus Yanofskybacteria bacterium RIFCSPHIGHO2_01_FULL_44_22]|uniref:tRNA N6-adenosine threonylcarbamoyltransferase n=1 Tax=Candidatus Yanofskybacteria bacterium RIFCSPHIGHO2_01_FULL_44_22 TaxID=1802669 RepID=A0A1F8EYG5_9BACT|nr:MAG: tRNA (adenosine(37)-N6)-threonylcarbamoyltransferase complex transferase subunit TsaD [Candidatus Yanofskybacteria bacterium RIFCSPHIGHO2_01_FULL_44_22]
MRILGIETSCDETAVAVLEIRGKNKISILSNIVSSQVKIHAKFGGVVPNLAAREHVKNIRRVFNLALKTAGIKDLKKEINLIAVTRGPGLSPALLAGLSFAKTIAWLYDKPIIGVNHLEGHIYSNWLPKNDNRPLTIDDRQSKNIFPALNLIVSGGHTELVLMANYGKYKLIGETLDDAAGEAFDKVARLLGLGYPGGPAISKIAKDGDPEKYPLPRPMLKLKNFDFSYSGLKTAVLYLIRDIVTKSPSTKFRASPSTSSGQHRLSAKQKADVAASFQKSATEVLVIKTVRAAKQYGVKSILLSGGVSANETLRIELKKNAEQNGFKYFQPLVEYTGDNAAMIALAGYFNYLTNKKSLSFYSWSKIDMDANLGFV